MTSDGSFCLESSLGRFLERCPELREAPLFKPCMTQVKDVDVFINTLAEVFLLRDYSIPLMGCFRPIAKKIVNQAVSLLRFVPDLRLNSNDMAEEVENEALNESSVTEFYSRVGKGLDLHELACLGLSRALDLDLAFLGSVLSYFEFAPPPFQRLLIGKPASELCVTIGSQLLCAVRTSYRFLLMESDMFSKLWDWSRVLAFAKQFTDSTGNLDILWCLVKITSVVLKLGDRENEESRITKEDALSCLSSWDQFRQDVFIEKARWLIEPSREVKSASSGRVCDVKMRRCSTSSGFNSQLCLEPPAKCQRLSGGNSFAGIPFVLTSALEKSSDAVKLAVSQKWPVLLYGPSGAGKSLLIRKLAEDSGIQVVSIPMDDQIDAKTLVGSYVCTEKPGEFRWQAGSLSQAVLNGYWVVFEDIDKAPSDVHSIILPLLEGFRVFLTGHGEEVPVPESFQLFGTFTTLKPEISSSIKGGDSLSVFWRRVMVGPPTVEDTKNIVQASYPTLEPIADKIIETFDRVKSSGNTDSVGQFSRFSLRDLLKWCKRIAGLGLSFAGNSLSADECKCIYQEAVDIFASFSTSLENRLSIRRSIAKMWMVPITMADTLYPADKTTIQDSSLVLTIGRVSLDRSHPTSRSKRESLVEIRSSLHLLENLAVSVKHNEAVLMVGETGIGKTTLVQELAMRLGQKLTVLNLSQQSDIADLLGGFKPMNAQFLCFPLYREFESLFSKTFTVKGNSEFLTLLEKHLAKKSWEKLLKEIQKCVNLALKVAAETGLTQSSKKRKKPLNEKQIKSWEELSVKVKAAHGQLVASSGIIFSFVEGAFVKAIKNGEWVLLDEVNLAPPETLQRVIGVLEGDNGSLCLTERGDINCIPRHPNFRLFGCMNPATDAGKRDLPFSLRSRFTEYYVDDVLDNDDLALLVRQVLCGSRLDGLVNKAVRFYKAAKGAAEEKLQDGANQKPQYSLRSLKRALKYVVKAVKHGESFKEQRAIYDGFSMFFQTLLDRTSAKEMDGMILRHLLEGKAPNHENFDAYLSKKCNNVELTSDDLEYTKNYILTKSIKENLRNVARAIFVGGYPVLLQGPTSTGKTSLIRYLAAITGHQFVRINNHEHTDLQEYLGTYVTDATGKLVFHEGVLVRAVRKGHWIVLDELNLAPSDVLEALNRLLDDNRELFVPELQETIKAHPNFMLFATQNPPTVYAGRKMLSRAFRNRFVEIHVDDIPEDESSTIIEQKCEIPGSYAKKMVNVMKELQRNRQTSKVFAGKHGYITLRDLFRWADRFRKLDGQSEKDLAKDGYYLLAEGLPEDEKSVILEVLNKELKGELDVNDLYKEPVGVKAMDVPQSVIWTKSMERLYFLVKRCYEAREPVLLVGETGGGKTTVCQLLSVILKLKLHILNCHQYTETSDFLGGFYPIRERSKLMTEYKEIVEEFFKSNTFKFSKQDLSISPDIGQGSSTLNHLQGMIEKYKKGLLSHSAVIDQDTVNNLEATRRTLSELHQKWRTIFKWQDGPLVHAMMSGDLFLIDEISLADDSVLERLNSVLEPERTLFLAEKGGSDLEKIVAHEKFLLLATMNPGGDFGKKELSPALRNRFTVIWVPPVSDIDNELRSIALQRLSSSFLVDPMLKFWEWFGHLQTGKILTVRDLLSWVDFINVTETSLGAEYACLHGVFLILLDGLSLGSGIPNNEAEHLRKQCLSFLLEQMKVDAANISFPMLTNMQNYGWPDLDIAEAVLIRNDMKCDNIFGIDPFFIQIGCGPKEGKFEFSAPTTRRNALRVLRAMQLSRPVLLEGSPGVGKTSLIMALGESSGHRVVRINLSEQTDMMDLLGSDLPVESDEGMKFEWSDGILLQALKEGSWVLLDELNLAPQSVLEGLNAILDHRAEVFIPELGRTFKCPQSFRIFACQNPAYQGGGRKGLPKSFLNRFTKVYVDQLVQDDYMLICNSCYPEIPTPLLEKLNLFNRRLYEETMIHHNFAQEGSPWEFNLRDVLRSCEIISCATQKSKEYCFLNANYIQRMRKESDRRKVLDLYEEIFETEPYINPHPRVELTAEYLIVGNTSIRRNSMQSSKTSNNSLKILPGIRQSLEAALHCVKHQWLCILVGPASSGKTSLIRLLAELSGNVLNELHLSSATDISEILGCFEQYDATRNFRSVVAQIECYVDEYNTSQVGKSKDEGFITEWFAFRSTVNHEFISSFASGTEEVKKRVLDSLDRLVGIVQHLLDKSVRSPRELDRAMNIVKKLREGHEKGSFSARFEWVPGMLIKAIERGEWIVLENANCCNPTVLDRINSLVESSGSITVNECGIVDGKPVVLHPHPNFRVFFTVNPAYGEVSRAMRNRGVEIFMDQQCDFDEFGLKDVKRFLAQSGIPFDNLVQAMSEAHIYARKEGLKLNISITNLELARWVQLFQQFVMNGNQLTWSLHSSYEHIYVSSFGEFEGRNIVSHAKVAFLSSTILSESSISSLALPGGWPMPVKPRDFVLYPRESTLKQNFMYLDFLACDIEPSLMGMANLRQILFPCDPSLMIAHSREKSEVKLAKKRLLFAANWATEQVAESELGLYLMWFQRFGSKLKTLSRFSYVLRKIWLHPVWRSVIGCYRELISLQEVKSLNLMIPVLSVQFVDEVAPSYEGKKILCNAINCVDLLKCTFKQWLNEEKHYSDKDVQPFMPLLNALKLVEEDFLNKLVELIKSLDFDKHIQRYADFQESHVLFWNCVKKNFVNAKKTKSKGTTESLGKLLIYWRLLFKSAEGLKHVCPEAVHLLLVNSGIPDKLSSWNVHSEKSLLWAYGGHPVLPSSSSLFNKQLQLLEFCESLWSTKTTSLKFRREKAGSENPGDCIIEFVAGSNSDLRSLVVEGISKLPIIMTKLAYENEAEAVQQLDEVYETLKKCTEHAKQKCMKNKLTISEQETSALCSYPTELLCHKSGFDSWQETLPLIDITSFSLDMELLQELSSALVLDSDKFKERLAGITENLKYAVHFSLGFSSRPPQMLSPHQKLLSVHDMWFSVDSVCAKASSFVLEMWFRWHQSLWLGCSSPVKDYQGTIESPLQYAVPRLETDCYDIPVPDVIVHPVMTNTVFQILKTTSTTPIRKYLESSLKIKVASCGLWKSLSPGSKLPCFLASVARNLFQQIILAHQKAFDAEKFELIKKILPHLWKNMTTHEHFCKELRDSSHRGLKSSVDTYIAPLLRELWNDSSSRGCLSSLGRAWLVLGELRLKLLLSGDDLDPAMKYHYKDLQLADKISSLKLELEVRQECNYLAGRLSTREVDQKQIQMLEKLEAKRRRLLRKVVFRSDYIKFQNIKNECAEFLARVKSSAFLRGDLETTSLEQIIGQGSNWQRMATAFIEKLSDKYPEYIDFVQPIQVAVYEIKLGFSLIVSSLVEKRILSILLKREKHRDEPYTMDMIMESVYTLMKFPWASKWKKRTIGLNDELPYEVKISADLCASDVDLLENLITSPSDAPTADLSVSPKLKASLKQNILFRTAKIVSEARIMDSSSFEILDKVFSDFAYLWSDMKSEIKTREESKSQQYKFRSRAFTIDSIIELDISALGNSSSNETFLEWKESMAEEEDAETENAPKKEENSVEEWNLVEESCLNKIVLIHNELFQPIKSGAFQISDDDRLLSFIDAYTLGTSIIRGLQGSFLSSLDSRLAPEHLLRLCLEHQHKFGSSQSSARRYNFYKDSNASEMSKMSKILCPLEEQVRSLLQEYENDYALQKILNVIAMLLNIPVSTPLAKALSGLQFLVTGIRTQQENGLKFPLSDQLDRILMLAVSWQKLEVESWPVLLDEVQHQYDNNAGKLLFPLYPILVKQSFTDMNDTIQSLEGFVQTSSIGEFRRRLQLLSSFMGQIHIGQCLKYFSSSSEMEVLKVLYNIIGFYAQFLPRLSEHIEAGRKVIEKELKELLKLCSWERRENFLSIENSKRIRQKFKKLVQKYNDLLEKPAMVFLNQDAELKRKSVQSKHDQKFLDDLTGRNSKIVDKSDLNDDDADDDRFVWYADWRERAAGSLRSLKPNIDCNAGYSLSQGIIQQVFASELSHLSFKPGWIQLKNIFGAVLEYDDLWKEETSKGQQKRMALTDLLKKLESTGLPRHKPVHIGENVKSWWFLEPSCGPTQNGVTSANDDKNVDSEWKEATESYFRSISSVLLLQQVSLNSHKDITLEQVECTVSFLHQLIEKQQEQRASASDFDKHLKCFKECVSVLRNLCSKCTCSDDGSDATLEVLRNNDVILQCMWQQKQLFDGLCSILHDDLLLLRTFDRTHSETCETVKAASREIIASIQKFFSRLKDSKELLDRYLLGDNRDITKVVPHILFVASDKMAELVSSNFKLLNEFENDLCDLNKEDFERSLVIQTLLGHFSEAFKEGKLVEKKFTSIKQETNQSFALSNEANCHKTLSELDPRFLQAITRTFGHIELAIKTSYSPAHEKNLLDGSERCISSWNILFSTLAKNMNLEHLCDELLSLISYAKKLLNDLGIEFKYAARQISAIYKNLQVFLDILSNFGDRLLKEHLDMHKTVCVMTRVLADVLASLYTNGFGTAEEQGNDDAGDSQKDATGTGMGEGVGMKDVSDQITDEDQLLGASNKPEEEKDASTEAPSKDNKGIEMEQDFEADQFDVSDDSEDNMDEDGENEDDQLDSAMGETGPDGEAVDEKLWDKENDEENPKNETEKYESGASVKDADPGSRELRAKDDSVLAADETNEPDSQDGDKSDGETGKEEELCDDGEINEDEKDAELNKDQAFADPTGLKPDDLEQDLKDDMDVDKEEDMDLADEADESADQEIPGEEENPNPDNENDETMGEDKETGKQEASTEKEELGADFEQNAQTNLAESSTQVFGTGISDSFGNNVPNSESLTETKTDMQASNSSNTAPEPNSSTSDNAQNGDAPLRGLPSSNASDQDMMISESANSGRNSNEHPQTQFPQNDPSSMQKDQPNPNRSLGDPLKEWKERVNVFLDLEADDVAEQGEEIHDEHADEYGYVAEFEKGTSQALGVATSEQVDSNINSEKTNENEQNKDDVSEMDTDKEKPETETKPMSKNAGSFPKTKLDDKKALPGVDEMEVEMEIETPEFGGDDNGFAELSDSLVSLRKSFYTEDVNQLNKLSIDDTDLGKAEEIGNLPCDAQSLALWRKYELRTTRLSQELAEQLRLVMEPTLASKLQGDYKTGKRINMKKVIPYIASHFRRDKIWLRRTRPNKRDYQVVIAVDDSLSMSENGCGDAAIQALVAVCRAMSQLEMANLAVTKFGKKGNIKSLHDFDQPFTGEAGAKMISSFTFKQENSGADNPVADLLSYLNNKLEAAVARARLPSGQNPLEQLVLIIADGSINENTKKVKRLVRDLMSQKRMVAFLVLDNPKQSILTTEEITMDGFNLTKSMYMDSFPFPFYIVLKNMEALPRTLADLLRQWFELMQHSRD